MKNKHFERRREAAKRYKKTTANSFASREVKGVTIYHVYEEPKKLSYWDDFAFVLGSQRIIVTWIHPRMAFMDAVQEEAEANVLAAYGPSPEWDLFANNKPIWKRVGKSRKQAKFYECAPVPVDYQAYRDKVHAEYTRLYKESTFIAKPSISIEQCSTGRHVAITYPVELLCENDIVTFVYWLKRHLQGTANIFAPKKDYTYTAANWIAEQD